MPGTLYVIATPIGNLEDLSPRALRHLGEVALVAAEDTRVTRKLFARYDLHTPLTSFHAHTGERKLDAIVARLAEGEDVALVSDAGTPGVSDPGGELVRAALVAGIEVIPIPGPSAVVTALCASGLDPSRFLFEGFLPRNNGDRRRVLARLRLLPHTLVFYEAPSRVAETLGALRDQLGDRSAVVARELTKKFEEFARGKLSALEERFRENAPRGECVLLVAGAEDSEGEAEATDEAIRERLGLLLRGGATVRDATRAVSEELGAPRNAVYAAAREIAEQVETEPQ
jgi:16S rRNA (cytidine1402-2'-O)-methyltransferase